MTMLRLKNLAILSRLNMSPLTVSVPIFGALTVTWNLTFGEIFGLGAIGLCAHIFGFALNDILDLSLDRSIPSRQNHPLATGSLSIKTSLFWVIAQVPLMLVIYKFALGGSALATSILGLSIFLSIIYNLFSKRGYFPRILAETALATSIGLLCLCGAFTKTATLPIDSIVFSITLVLVLLLINSVPNHLKDIKTDKDFGVQSFVLATGTTVIGDDEIIVSKFLWGYSIVLQTLISFCIVGLIILIKPTWFYSCFAVLFVIYSSLHLRMILSIKSFVQIRQSLPLLNGVYNYFALSFFVSPAVTGFLAFIYWLIIVWLFAIPFYLAWQIWRNPYRIVSE